MRVARLVVILGASLAVAFTLWIAPAGRIDAETEATVAVQAPVPHAVVDEVMTYVSGWRVADDPLVYASNGAQVKTSAIQGVMIEGKVYYYSLRPHQSFDPWTRGEVADNRIVVVARVGEDTPNPVIIYQLK